MESLAYYSFDEMRSVDLRHYKTQSISDYIAAYQPDVVICIRDYEALPRAATTAALLTSQGGLL